MTGFVKTWSGMANEWECDELGHLNMRFYLTKAMEARYMFMMQLGLHHGFKPGAPSTVRLKDVHIKYMKEARPGAQLYIETGLVEIDTTSLKVVHIMYHGTGDIAATLSETLHHIYRPTNKAFTWPKRVRNAAEKCLVPKPDVAMSKGLSMTEPMTGPSLSQVKDWGCDCVGRGVFHPNEANVFHTIAAQAHIRRLSDSVAMFKKGWPDFDLENWHEAAAMGVMLELRQAIHVIAKPGDPYEIYSGVRAVTGKVRQIVHNFVNPFTGQSYATIIAVNGLLHMSERKLVDPEPDHYALLQKAIIPELHG